MWLVFRLTEEYYYSLSGLDLLSGLHVISSERQSLVDCVSSLLANAAALGETVQLRGPHSTY